MAITRPAPSNAGSTPGSSASTVPTTSPVNRLAAALHALAAGLLDGR
ncbi:hypothetical protein [Crossiella cryophila]|uniref:Uncharacterized protein n=1 Tax=Crossiella cryophila TaxID=43355 RepID=A0A7W7CFE7_9PSEU|nr:hypothetical protein [Crossiella cryophila]MBB4679967.1 hypothetical protein [Crossiella cryophila]